LRFIKLPFSHHGVVAPVFQVGIPVTSRCPPQRRALQRRAV